MEGWIKLHRQLTEWEWYTDINTCHLFLHLLLSCNHEDNNWRGIEIKKGEVLTGLHSLSEKTGLSQRSVRTSLEHLKSTNEVTIKSTNKYSIISIASWEKYQTNDKQTDTQQTNKRQATDNKQEGKELKNESIYAKKEKPIETKIIEMFFTAKQYKLNKKEYSNEYKRYIRTAKQLVSYSERLIAGTILHCIDNFSDWKLEAVSKNIIQVRDVGGNFKSEKGSIDKRIDNLISISNNYTYGNN